MGFPSQPGLRIRVRPEATQPSRWRRSVARLYRRSKKRQTRMRAMVGDLLDAGREAFARRGWSAARSAYEEASKAGQLTLDDLERYAISAHLVGNDAESPEALTLGYREALTREDVSRAVQFAYWIGHSMIFTDELAQASSA
jgi:hypothetical protein